MEAIAIKCPHCGAAVTTEMKVCEYCDEPVIIVPSTVNKFSKLTPPN